MSIVGMWPHSSMPTDCSPMRWRSLATLSKPRTWYRKHTFAPWKRWDGCANTVMRRHGCIPSCETFGSTKYGNDVPSRSWLNLIRLRMPQTPSLDSATAPHSLYVNKVEKQQVRVALHRLPEEYREIIALREY